MHTPVIYISLIYLSTSLLVFLYYSFHQIQWFPTSGLYYCYIFCSAREQATARRKSVRLHILSRHLPIAFPLIYKHRNLLITKCGNNQPVVEVRWPAMLVLASVAYRRRCYRDDQALGEEKWTSASSRRSVCMRRTSVLSRRTDYRIICKYYYFYNNTKPGNSTSILITGALH